MKRFLILAISGSLFLGITQRAEAQIDFDSFLEAGIEDANSLFEQYMDPAFVGFGFGMNSGWYNTAKPHKFLGFDITASVSAAFVPTSAEFFTFNNADYDNVRLSDANDNRLPTLFGPNLGADDLPELTFTDPTTGAELVRITAPTGLGIEEDFPFNAVPVPMAQVGIGLFKGLELKVRYVPDITFDDDGEEQGSVRLFGLGAMYDIKRLLPADKLLPFDLSLFAGYSNLNSSIYIDRDANQLSEFTVDAWTAQAVISKKLLFLTVYGGLGYASSSVDFALKGDYTTETLTFTDPINLSFENSGVRTNVGARLKLLIFTIGAEYAFQEYNTLTASFGISFR